MSSQYPTGLDSLATNKTNNTTSSADHPQHHNDLADAVNKVEAELGINPSGTDATVAARFTRIEAGGSGGGGTFTGGTISGFTTVDIGSDTTHTSLDIKVPIGTSTYPFLIEHKATDPAVDNQELRWFMAHPEGGLCLSSAMEPNWSVLHLYPHRDTTSKPIIRITKQIPPTGTPPNVFTVLKDGQVTITPQTAGLDLLTINSQAGATVLKVSDNGTMTGTAAAKLSDPDTIVFKALGFKTWTATRPTNAGDVAPSQEMRMSAIGLRGGETYSNAYFGANTAAAGLTLARIGIYDTSFNLVASTANAFASVNGVTGLVNLALSSSFTPAADNLYYIGLLSVGTTAPGVYQIVGGNMNDTSFGGKYLGWRTFGQTDLPATATRSGGTQPYWFALS